MCSIDADWAGAASTDGGDAFESEGGLMLPGSASVVTEDEGSANVAASVDAEFGGL